VPTLAQLTPPPDASSRQRAWNGVVVDLHKWQRAGQVTSYATDHDIIAMRVSGVTPLVQRRDGKTHRSVATAGNVTVHPRGMDSTWAWERPGAIVVIRLPHKLLLDAAESDPHPSQTELPNCFGGRDPFVEHIAMALAHEVEQPSHPAQLIISQSLSYALAHHMVHRFRRTLLARSERPSGLARASLGLVLSYIEENLGEPITLDMLAQLANVSRFHFARMFRRSTGLSPMAYIERSRLERSRDLIRSGALSLTEIAALLGFADQSHFTRRFRRQFGYTPSAYAREQRNGRAIPSNL
jgi:AraC family transcriptional regulator